MWRKGGGSVDGGGCKRRGCLSRRREQRGGGKGGGGGREKECLENENGINTWRHTQVCASGPTCVFRRGPGRPNTRVSTRRGWIKAAASCLLSSPSSSSPTGPTLQHACAPAYVRGIRWYRMLLEFLFLLASEEQAVCSNIARNYCRRPFPDPEKERKEGVG